MIARTLEDRLAELFSGRPKHLSVDMRVAIKRRDGYRCHDCGARPVCLHIHHITPRWLGGTHAPENLISVCDGCHLKRHRQLPRHSNKPKQGRPRKLEAA